MSYMRDCRVAIGTFIVMGSMLCPSAIVEGAKAPPLGTIALRPSDLPAGAHLVKQGVYRSSVQGYTSGYRWTFKDSRGAVMQVESMVVKYNAVTSAAEGAIIEGERQCGSKQTIANYAPISPQVGDYATGCYYSTHGGARNNVIVVLRRFSYVAVVHVTGKRSLDYFHLTPLTERYAATVDRRVEIAVHGSGLPGSSTGKKSKATIAFLSCNHRAGCLFHAQGHGSAYAGAGWSKMPRSWRFSPTSQYKVSYAFACGHYAAVSDGFELFQRDEFNVAETLRGIGDGRDSGQVQAQLSPGARHGALQIHVQNSSCQWVVEAVKYNNPFPQP